MTLRHIEIFSVVCQEGSITRAAERLHISQPTVSVAIREMEEYYGGCLFDRISHKLYITPFGQRIYDYALRLLNLYADMADAKFSFDRLRIGSGTAIGKLFMPTVVKSFLSLYPDIQICVNVGEATRMYHLVMKNALDFVIAEVVDDISGLSHHSIQHVPVVAVCHRSNPLAEKAVVTAPELAREHLLLRELGSHTRSGVDTYFQTHNLTVVPMWESYSVQSLPNAATEGIGVSFLSLDHVLAYGSPDLVILNIPDFRAERYVHVCYHKDKIFTPLIQNFLDYYVQSTKALLQEGIKRYQAEHAGSTYSFPQL